VVKKTKKQPVKKEEIIEEPVVFQPKNYLAAVGRRKTSTCRVRIWEGKGEITVNDKPALEYFKAVGAQATHLLEKPFIAVGRRANFDGSINVNGGGIHSQLGAIVHGLSRALDKYEAEDFHKILRKNELLTRDPREKERRKFGLMGARKHKASPKR
jgi:small subunit ribosomal protein S9